MIATCIWAVGFLDVSHDKILGLIFYEFLFVCLSIIQNTKYILYVHHSSMNRANKVDLP